MSSPNSVGNERFPHEANYFRRSPIGQQPTRTLTERYSREVAPVDIRRHSNRLTHEKSGQNVDSWQNHNPARSRSHSGRTPATIFEHVRLEPHSTLCESSYRPAAETIGPGVRGKSPILSPGFAESNSRETWSGVRSGPAKPLDAYQHLRLLHFRPSSPEQSPAVKRLSRGGERPPDTEKVYFPQSLSGRREVPIAELREEPQPPV